MKKLFLLTALFIFSFSEITAQCTGCGGTTNTGTNSSAIGTETVSTGHSSFASGVRSQATEDFTTALGFHAYATYSKSIAIGSMVKADKYKSIVIGAGEKNADVYLTSPTGKSLTIGFNSQYPTLFVSTSPQSGYYDKTGRIAIGNMTDPQAKLHIYSDDNESATLFLQPSNWNLDYDAEIWLGDTSHSISAVVNKGLVFNTGNHFIFNNGFLGLATDEPSALLDVNGTARIRGLSGENDRIVLADSLGNLKTGAFYQSCTSCENTQNTGTNSSAIGFESISSGNASFASGFRAEATENYTTALGFYSKATYSGAIAIGSMVKSNAHDAVVIGSGGPWNEDMYLENNIPRSLMVGFSSIFPTLFVCESNEPWFTKTGRVAIGNMTSPIAKLHIYSDNDEPATLFLQPSNWSAEYNAEIWLGDTSHSISAEIDEGLIYQTQENHVFKGGNIYIEDIDKGIIMKSPDGRCWLGKLDNNGTLNFELMESCPGEPNAIFEKGQSNRNGALKVYPNPTNDYLNIEMENPEHKLLSVSLLDEKGTELKFSKTTAAKTMLYTGDLMRGVYFVKVTGDGFQRTAKVIK
ncbi:MAG: T9SS type A sorting domain-containing protein [Chlorobi bacterium]|nr:T9SS type A sorting domain-containing protein [Chlorobiota bacterium]